MDYFGTEPFSLGTTTKENALHHSDFSTSLETICQRVAIPVKVIGGLIAENIDQLIDTGIAGVAVVRDLDAVRLSER